MSFKEGVAPAALTVYVADHEIGALLDWAYRHDFKNWLEILTRLATIKERFQRGDHECDDACRTHAEGEVQIG